jgi:shikimate dehydrogenase
MEFIKTGLDIFLHLDKHLAELLTQYGTLTYAILFLIIFVETGLIVMPLLPGDSLLFAAGALAAATGKLDITIIIPLLILAALLGDNVNYFVGKFFSATIKSRDRILFFKREYITETEAFYAKHGGQNNYHGALCSNCKNHCSFCCRCRKYELLPLYFVLHFGGCALGSRYYIAWLLVWKLRTGEEELRICCIGNHLYFCIADCLANVQSKVPEQASMRKFGLIGLSLTHSFSKKYFEEKFQRENIQDCSYDLFELNSIEELPSLLKSNPELVGLNVTIPYKEPVIDYLDDTSNEAKLIGAVNCIKVENGKLVGYNTDVFGFETSLTQNFSKFSNFREVQAFILGTGGSSKAVEFVLKKMRLPFVKVSRDKKSDSISYQEIEGQMKAKNLFINSTPLGMFPEINAAPEIPYHLLSENDFLFDLIYNPAETEFLKRGKQKNSRIKSGLEMLQLQAEKSWEIWNL